MYISELWVTTCDNRVHVQSKICIWMCTLLLTMSSVFKINCYLSILKNWSTVPKINGSKSLGPLYTLECLWISFWHFITQRYDFLEYLLSSSAGIICECILYILLFQLYRNDSVCLKNSNLSTCNGLLVANVYVLCVIVIDW